MDEQRLRELIHLARGYYNLGKDLEPWFAFEQVSAKEREAILAAVVPDRGQIQDEGLGVGPNVDVTWLDRMQETDWQIWRAHERYLRFTLDRADDMVNSISVESESILRRLPDPQRPTFTGKGLVIGYVQSGKTANFTAVAARAVDAGYRMVIVLSGIHNNLRAQTQRRLDRELAGRLLEGEKGIERPEHGRGWYRLTERGEVDFTNVHDHTIMESPLPILAVIKKNCTILQQLLDWIAAADDTTLNACPVLIIDDEADQASINTGQDRSDDPQEVEDEETSPSKTNALIRELISKLPRVAYLAYTATPFANILMDPGAEDRFVGSDLYPRDFIWQLPRPEGYTGTLELFGTMEHESREVLRIIPPEDMGSLRPPSKNRSAWCPTIPPTMIDAIDEYLLAGAVRTHRGQGGQPHTMLVHTVHYKECHGRVTDYLKEYVEGLKGALSFGAGLDDQLKQAWEQGYHHSLDDADEISFDDIQPHIADIVGALQILELNSDSDDMLDFEGPQPIKAICVGGNRLSRGLTLEGLTVSVFVRPTSMADTLLQMARWYGFRIGYADTIRIYTTQAIAEWFAELALVEDDLRAEVDRLRTSGLTPEDIGIRLRAHSALRLTSATKGRHGVVRQESWGGSHPQNIVLPIDSIKWLQSDFDVTSQLLTGMSLRASEAGLVASATPEQVISYLTALSFCGTEATRTFNIDSICRWIHKQNGKGRLTNWTIHVPSNSRQDAARITVTGHEHGLINRSRLRGSNSIGVLIDPRHEAFDLDVSIDTFKRGSGFDTNEMRRYRSDQQGLLLIYLLDPASDSTGRDRERLIPIGEPSPPAVVSVGLSLPHVPDDEARTVIVNEAFADA